MSMWEEESCVNDGRKDRRTKKLQWLVLCLVQCFSGLCPEGPGVFTESSDTDMAGNVWGAFSLHESQEKKSGVLITSKRG